MKDRPRTQADEQTDPSMATEAKTSSAVHSDRQTVSSSESYAEAERDVNYLAENGFPVNRTAIVGHDLKIVEQVLGRTNYLESVARGATGGALTGVLFGWIFGLLDWIHPLVASVLLALYGLIFGAVVGALLGLLIHWLHGGRRDFRSVSVMVPERFDVVVDAELREDAVRLLAEAPWNRQVGSHRTPN